MPGSFGLLQLTLFGSDSDSCWIIAAVMCDIIHGLGMFDYANPWESSGCWLQMYW
jgi:hypothetical protein